MHVRILSLLALGLLLSGSVWAQTTLTLTVTPTQQQLDITKLLINEECQKRIASGDSAMVYCTVTDGRCDCNPDQAQLETAMEKLFLQDGFQEDKNRYYNAYGQEVERRFKAASKSARDQCSTALGMPLLP
jgi:hypothetical protein